MFRLHETKRKWLCRGAFIALCAAPTLGTLGWVVRSHLPWRAAGHAIDAGHSLHAAVELADWQTPRPGMVRVSRAAFRDATTGEELCVLTGVERRTTSAGQFASAERATIDLTNLPAVAERLAELMAQNSTEVRELRIAELVIESSTDEAAGSPQTAPIILHDVTARLDRAGETSRLRFAARLPGGVARLSFELSGLPATAGGVRMALDTTEAPIPSNLLGVVGPLFKSLGEAATFAGRIDAEFRDSRTIGRATGKIAGVDLAGLLPTGSPHRLRGTARVELEELTWQEGRVVRLAGTARAEQVEASPSLVTAANKQLLCVLTKSLPATAGEGAKLLPLDRVAVTFIFDAKGLTLWGACPGAEAASAGCLAMSEGSPLIIQPPYVDLPAGAWVQFVAGPAQSWLPATREAVSMAERLPLPGSAGDEKK